MKKIGIVLLILISLTGTLLGCVHHADVAQLAEQLICNQQVIGSSPIIGFHQLSWKDGYGPLAQLVRATGS